jgi:hypothetical protein
MMLMIFKAEDKNNKFMSSEGMEATEEEIQEFVEEESLPLDSHDMSLEA